MDDIPFETTQYLTDEAKRQGRWISEEESNALFGNL